MSDFDDLRRVREAKESARALVLQKKMEEERRQVEAKQRFEQRKGSHFNRLNDTVVEVLEALRDAVYPGYEVRSTADILGEPCWGIGVIHEDWEYGKEFHPFLTVKLEFDKRGEARRFLVSRGFLSSANSKSVTRGLSREELTQTLRKLHPPRVIEKIPPPR
jgi:hypothetical protein